MADIGVWLRGLFGGKDDANRSPSSPEARARPGGAKSFAEDNNDFALAMFEHLRQPPRNLVVSPFSIRVALGMALAGARGDTAVQMRNALCISSSDETLHAAISRIVQQLNAAAGGTKLPKWRNLVLRAHERSDAGGLIRA